MSRYLLLLFAAGALLATAAPGCKSKKKPAETKTEVASAGSKQPNQKMDPILQQELAKAETGEKIEFLGEVSGELNNDLKAELEQSGVDIRTVAGKIFTASGEKAQIEALAAHDKIVFLSGSRKFKQK